MQELSPESFQRLSHLVQERFRLQLADRRHHREAGGVQRFARYRGFQSVDDLLDTLEEDGNGFLAGDLVDRLSTGVGEFLPDRVQLEFLRRDWLPAQDPQPEDRRRLHLWVPGCGTGGDAWLLACALEERFGSEAERLATLLATDCSAQALAVAVEGIYDSDSAGRLPASLRAGTFDEDPPCWRVADRLRGLVRFRRQKAAWQRPSLLAGWDAIFCAGMLRYFGPDARAAMIRLWQGVLRPGGLLVTGAIRPREVATGFRLVTPGVYQNHGSH